MEVARIKRIRGYFKDLFEMIIVNVAWKTRRMMYFQTHLSFLSTTFLTPALIQTVWVLIKENICCYETTCSQA